MISEKEKYVNRFLADMKTSFLGADDAFSLRNLLYTIYGVDYVRSSRMYFFISLLINEAI